MNIEQEENMSAEEHAEWEKRAEGSNSALIGLLSGALKALCLTRDYVGGQSLPVVDGWEWYEAGKAIAKELPNDAWTMEFVLRTGYCPQCQSDTGIKIPRGMDAYCEDCGWPDEDFAAGG